MNKINLNIQKLWTLSLMFYIICCTAFSYGSLRILNTLALYFFFGVSLLNLLNGHRIRIDFTIISLVLYMVLLLAGMLYTPTRESVVQGIIYNYITTLILVFCVVQYLRQVQDLEKVMFAYMLAGLALAIYVYAQYGNEFWQILQANAEQEDYNRVNRLGDELANVNTIGLFTAFSVVIGVYNLIYSRTSKLKTVISAIVVICCFVVSMASGSKKTLLVIFVSFFGMYVYSAIGSKDILKQIRNLILAAAAVAVVIVLLTKLPVFSGIVMRYESLFSFLKGGEGTNSEVVRMDMISRGLGVWLDYPLFGAGTAASTYYFGYYSHNNYIEILMNTGLIGLLVFYGVYLYVGYKYLINASYYKTISSQSILLFSIFLSVSICGATMVYYYDRYCMILLASVFVAVKLLDTCRESAFLEGNV